MSSKKYTFDEAEDYLFGHMNAEDSAAFEAAMSEDPSLARMVNQQRLEHEAMALMLKDDFRQQLRGWKAEKEANPPVLNATRTERKGFSLLSSRVVQIAAAACALLVIGYFVQQSLQGPGYPALASNYFDQTVPAVRSSDEQSLKNIPASIQEAVELMRQNKFAEAAGKLKLEADGYEELQSLLLIECYFQLQQFDEALNLCRVLEQPGVQPDTKEKAEWYSVLCLLAKQETGAPFQQRLDGMVNDPEHSYHNQAKKLKTEL